ncbi:trichome birefringence [Thalictrum thalictroides]|uniref:Trichome birefringence n=1 Tax=Thalictrum thalictroides TaxID=46969 RepID=A0A7J6URR6_THATH|nr:trichome birefringence [Thalictrum thalictroides]
MDFKKLLKSFGLSEQFTSKNKVFSGFGLGVIASVLVVITVFFLNHPLNTSSLYPVFQEFNGVRNKSSSIVSWPFQFPTTSSGSTIVQDVTTSLGVVLERSKNESSLSGSNDVGFVSNQTHEGIVSDTSKNSSLIDSSLGKLVSENPQSGNSSQSEKNYSSIDFNGGKLGNQRPQNASFLGENTHQGNLSAEANSTQSSNKDDGLSTKTSQVQSVDGNKNGSLGSLVGELARFAEKSTDRQNGGNVSDSVENVRSNVTKENDLKNTKNSTAVHKDSGGSGIGDDFAKCDIFDGRWVRDEQGKPYYPAGSCPYIDRDFDCHLNGRPDDDFVKWRWQPNHCNIPSLNATDFLERLRGKRLVFVGDSLNRNMWESLVCILRHSVKDKKKVYEISGKREFKKKGFYAFHYEDFNCSIDFVSSPFLVRELPINKNGLTETLRLDVMDMRASMYHDADVMVFNTGHWWTHEKTSKGENYYQEGNHVYPRLKVMDAYTKALNTWGRWIDNNVDVKKSQVFFRGYSVTHFRGGQWNSGGQCHQETEPIYNDTFLAKYPVKMRALEQLLPKMKTPVVYLNISKLTDYRKDAHPSIYRKEYKTAEEKLAAVGSQDCSHWCLPGVPDTWNELLYASLLQNGRGSWRK